MINHCAPIYIMKLPIYIAFFGATSFTCFTYWWSLLFATGCDACINKSIVSHQTYSTTLRISICNLFQLIFLIVKFKVNKLIIKRYIIKFFSFTTKKIILIKLNQLLKELYITGK